jgi:hypothetical protein
MIVETVEVSQAATAQLQNHSQRETMNKNILTQDFISAINSISEERDFDTNSELETEQIKFYVTLSSPYSEVDDEGIEAEERRVDVTWDYAPNLGDWQDWLRTYNEMEGGEYYFHDVRLVNWEMEF